MVSFDNLFKTIQIKNTFIRNRIVMAAINNNYADPDGKVTQQLVDYFAERAKGGVGLIITGATAIDASAKKRVGELCVHSNDFIDGLKELTTAVHSEGAKIFLQIMHVGQELVSNTTEAFSGEPVGPSAIPHPLNGKPCHELSIEEIHELQQKFIQSAVIAEMSGFDGVEVHGAHGYLINQFTHPFNNRRLDEYGGGLEGRARFSLEIVKGIRERVGTDFLIGYRLNINEYFEQGLPLQIDESLNFAKKIGKFVDLINVATGSTRTPKSTRKIVIPMSKPQGCYAPLAAAVKGVVQVPVICVGRIIDPEIAESILERKDADMIAIGRGLIADPHWANKVRKRNLKEIRRCIGCNQGCIEYLIQERKITCLYNPAVGKERDLTVTPTKKKKKILIIGGGVGGMEAARVAALKGHQVEIFERTEKMGGNFNLASITPWKHEFKRVVNYFEHQMEKLNILVNYNTEGTVSKIKEYNPDAVILATGARPKTTQLVHSGNGRIFLAEEVLLGETASVVSPVCVIGGGLVGLEVASYLALYGHEVSVMEVLQKVGMELGAINRGFWLEKISELGISMHTECELVDLGKNKLKVRKCGEQEVIEMGLYSSYVIALGYESNDMLSQELKREAGKIPFTVHSIGDSVSPRTALHAIREGCSVAHSL